MKNCECKSIDNYSRDPEVPIGYNSKFDEYYIYHGPDDGGEIYLKYCFACGGQLPESKRGDYFTKPDQALVEEYEEKLKGVKSADEIIKILGKPDWQYDSPPIRDVDKELYGIKEQKRQFDYKRLSDTFILSVSEYVDGTIDYCFFGKEVG